jgi:hypothetical protein
MGLVMTCWKFGNVTGQQLHGQRLARLALTGKGPASDDSTLSAEVPAAPSKSTMPPHEDRIEPTLLAHGPSVGQSLAGGGLNGGPDPLPVATGVTELDVADFPHSDLTWDVPAFPGGPDDLPDLRPAPMPPMEHPGLQFRSLNTFGHALRLPAEDERQVVWADQRRDRGFDDTELWGLDDAFARFILPRLKALRQQKLESPSSKMELTSWYGMLDKMIRAFELLLPEGGGAWSRGTLTDRERAQVQDGLDLFRQYFFSLSW